MRNKCSINIFKQTDLIYMYHTEEYKNKISTVITEIADLYAQFQKNKLKNNSSTIQDANEMEIVCRDITLSNIYSLLDQASLLDINLKQKVHLKLFDFDKLLSWHQKYLIDQERHRLDGHNFNVFKLFAEQFDLTIKETMHSKLLFFLLNQNANHGQGSKFLENFLIKLGIDQPHMGNWRVTAEQGRIDLLLKRNNPHSVIIIENKSNWATDQHNQLYRYWYDQIYCSIKKADEEFYVINKNKYQIIYLAPNINKRVEEQSLLKPKEWLDTNLPNKIPLTPTTLTFDGLIQDWLLECELELKEENRVRQYIAQYRELCNIL